MIEERTYQMCPTCPSFSIPIPVPKEVITPKKRTIMERFFDIVKPAINTAKDTVTELFNNAVDTNDITEKKGFSGEDSNITPLMYAGAAVIGLGVATLLSSGLQLMAIPPVSVGRHFDGDDGKDDLTSDILNYNVNDIRCIPRTYCEQLKRKKHMIDEYPLVKKVASMMSNFVFDKDTVLERGESSVWNQCYVRECVFTLLQ